ncbi:MAG: WYL domain-containing protein [Muribaculaceae bacterium]|nr:WYL domain-containing protein [Muribaculaceae bacterium]MDE6522397.1 WYL domain-containing protein [Muribaculaceae bacterium]MDE6786074.1 WYL domain-containing protein [Muribaculaceae bacterium]
MAKDKVAIYIWIIDTILKHGKLSKKDLNELWKKKVEFSGGLPMADRTFYKYRRAIEDTFCVEILCTSDGYYWIDSQDSIYVKQFTEWTLNNSVATNVIHELGTSSGRVQIEDIPSAREFLPIVATAMNNSRKIVFTYAGFARSRPEVGILFSPYFLKLYKQRWYMFGKKSGGGLRTYALDRVTEMEVTDSEFVMPSGIKMEDYFGSIVGVTSSRAGVREVYIQTTATRAKYLRALPLHHSQKEEVHDFYSIFRYELKLNYELVSELMAMGPDVIVIQPKELQIMLIERLRETLNNYQQLI